MAFPVDQVDQIVECVGEASWKIDVHLIIFDSPFGEGLTEIYSENNAEFCFRCKNGNMNTHPLTR